MGFFEAHLCHSTWVLSQGFEPQNSVPLQRDDWELLQAEMYEYDNFSVQMCVFDVSRQLAVHACSSQGHHAFARDSRSS